MAEHTFYESNGYLLSHVCKLYRTRANERLEALGLHQGQDLILCELWLNDGQTQTELVGRLCVQPSTVTNSLHSLERAGLIQRRSDAEDQRVSRVHLTERLREIWPQIKQAQDEVEAEAFANLSLEERVLLRRLLMQVADNLSGAK